MGEFAEQALAQLLSRQGGFGLRPLIERGLQAQRETSEAASGSS
jgi:Rod binding domain-containing protein